MNLLKNERAIVDEELEKVDQSLVDSRSKIARCISKCQEALQWQKSSNQVETALKKLEDVKL